MQKLFCIILLACSMSSCSSAKDTRHISEAELDKQIVQTRIMAISSNIQLAGFLYKAAYKTADRPSDINDKLFIYALDTIESLFNSYDMGKLNYS